MLLKHIRGISPPSQLLGVYFNQLEFLHCVRKLAVVAKIRLGLRKYKNAVAYHLTGTLKVPKREIFSLSFFALSEPIWVCDLGTGGKNRIFYQLTPDFDGFWFFAAY